jgi:iron complex outermembrane receptor protein
VGNREPKRSNFTDSRPGEIIRPERLHDFEFGHKYQSMILSTGINAYFMNYRDQLVLTGEINDVGSAIMVNVPESYRAGIEFMLGLQPIRNIRWEANATISRNRIKSFVEYVDDWDTWGQQTIDHENTSLSFSPEIIASSRISWEPIKNFNINLTSKYVGKQFIDNTSSEERRLDPYLVNNIRLAYEFKPGIIKKVNLFVDLINLFNEMYESNAWVYSYFYEGNRSEIIGYYPQAGRHFIAGVVLDL